jgi:soluble lytic murein transglycosylase
MTASPATGGRIFWAALAAGLLFPAASHEFAAPAAAAEAVWSAGNTMERDMESYMRAYAAVGEGRAEAALPDLSRLMREGGVLSNPAALLAAEALSLVPGRSEAVLGIVGRARSGSPPAKGFAGSLTEAALEAMLRDARPDDALMVLRASPDGAFSRPLAALAELYDRGGCGGESQAMVRELLAEYAGSTEARRFERALLDPSFASTLSDAFWRRRAQRLFEARQNGGALSALAKLERKIPEDFETEGLCLFRQGAYGKAAAALSHSGSARALYHLAACCRRLKLPKEDRKVTDALLASAWRDEWWSRAAMARVKELRAGGDEGGAGALLETIALQSQDASFRKDALWSLAWSRLWRKDFSGALPYLERSLAAADALHWEEKLRAEFWRGRCLEELGRFDAAAGIFTYIADEYPAHYYAMHSRGRLQKTGRRPAAPGTASWRETERGGAGSEPSFLQAASLLAQMGLAGESQRWIRLWEEQAKAYPHFWAMEVEAALAQDDTRVALRAFDRMSGCPRMTGRRACEVVSGETLRRLYPLKFWEPISREAAERSLDPLLVAALIQQESCFNPGAVSRAGARGLMQIMPSTGRVIARQHGERYATASLYNVNTNVRYGTYYLARQLERFGGRADLALAAYNGGPNRVSRWMSEWNQPDMEFFVDNIPLDETRLYVKRVLSHYGLYRSLYGSDASAAASGAS